MTTPIVTLTPGTQPLLISIPHGGECLPAAFAQQMTPIAQQRADTDWHLAQLYDFARALGASIVQANYSRYIIDVNRPRDGSALYPGQTTTTLCPISTFHGEPLYATPDQHPDAQETSRRIEQYWQPYHDALGTELTRLRDAHRHVLLWEAHSIASVLPYLFQGRLPDLNIGTFDGAACAPRIRGAVVDAASAGPFSWALDERFKGGHITRHYGRPEQGVHAVQLEMAQCLYMEESAPFTYRADLAARVLPTMQSMVGNALAALATLGD